ncbi:CBS domain-containing protein [Nocardioides massiliensis]|uniref:CBS domain-containing protein n=1 Tax=Nocardioides massiliensis TaxID=1325935 RepID=A0ABT9NU94_9ACTN|nr:CBS domain-containing protein [Nocardioides massiliensis]MDP9824006.1 CBS domain-containing protein [Nocardioides massiliensis]
MTPDPVTTRAARSVKAALQLLDENDITSLPVVDEDHRIRGVVSEADLLRDLISPDPRLHVMRTIEDPPPPFTFVEDVMSSPAVTVKPDSDLTEAIDLVLTKGMKCLPVVDDDDRVVGVLSRRDVVRVLARDDDVLEQEVADLFTAAGRGDWDVTVDHGVAEISGPPSAPERTLATALARSVPGVVGVRVVEDA